MIVDEEALPKNRIPIKTTSSVGTMIISNYETSKASSLWLFCTIITSYVISLPVGIELVQKIEKYLDPKSGKEKHCSTRTKDEMYHDLIQQAVKNQFFSNMCSMTTGLPRQKTWTLSIRSKQTAKWQQMWMPTRKGVQRVNILELEAMKSIMVLWKAWYFILFLVKQVFANEDGSTDSLYLISGDTILEDNGITAIYQKRWNVESYCKSLEQNASYETSPKQTMVTQTNNFFAVLYGYINLELLKGETKLDSLTLCLNQNCIC